jgi:ABC-type transport system involved in multi-copper enzyme maturation permease subunit
MSRVVVLETLRRHYTNLLPVAYVVLVAIMGLASSRLEGEMWSTFITLLAIGAGATLIGPEFSSGTLQLILVKPINRAVYLVSRVTGVVLFVASAAVIAFLLEAGGRLMWGGTEKIAAAAIALANGISQAALICAILALFGTFLRAYFNVGLFWLIQVALSVAIGMLNVLKMAKSGLSARIGAFVATHPIIDEALAWLTRNLFADPPHKLDRGWLLMVWSNALVALVLACLIFRDREVPYGAD